MKTIFVSIASYRDNQCPITLKSLYENAKFPERIYVGICQQNKLEDIDCINKEDEVVEKNRKNIRVIKLEHYEAKGPTWARYLCSKLYDGEDYYFQIDSHTKVVKDWDEKLEDMIERIGYKKSVISHYPPMIEEYDGNTTTNVPRICKSFFNDREMISFNGAENHETNGNCYEVPYVAGGMFFCKGEFLRELPFDPTLDYLFVGEEILLSARFWTNGWNIYTPSTNIAFHFYTRKDEPKIWTDMVYKDDDAFDKVKSLLLLTKQNKNKIDNNYGLGKERTLNEYYSFAGIDIKNRIVTKNFCKPNNMEEVITNNQKNYKKYLITLLLLLLSIISLIIYIKK